MMSQKLNELIKTMAVDSFCERVLTIKEAEVAMGKIIDYLIQEKAVNVTGLKYQPGLPGVNKCIVKIKQRI